MALVAPARGPCHKADYWALAHAHGWQIRPQGERRARLDVALSRAELAEMAGIRPETAMRILSRFKADKFINFDGRRIIVLNPNKLPELAEPFPIMPKESLL